MGESMNILAVVTARGGSQRVALKNIARLMGRPMLAYTLDHLHAAELVTRTVVSTEDPRIARVARSEGAEVIARPEELATPEARLDHVLRHAVAAVEQADGWWPDIVLMLYGAVPIRPAGFIDHCVRLLEKTEADSVRSLTPAGERHPLWSVKLDDHDRIDEYQGKLSIFRRQDLPKVYYYTGACLAFRRDVLMRTPADPNDNFAYFGAHQVGAVHEPDECVEIHEPIDLLWAEFLMTQTAKKQDTLEPSYPTLAVCS